MLPLEGTLPEKLRKIEALHARTSVDGEREAARRAAERIRTRLAELRGREQDEELHYRLPDPGRGRSRRHRNSVTPSHLIDDSGKSDRPVTIVYPHPFRPERMTGRRSETNACDNRMSGERVRWTSWLAVLLAGASCSP